MRIQAIGANFYIGSYIVGEKALVYRMDSSTNQKVAFLGEVVGYFYLRDTLFANTKGAWFLNGQPMKYSTDDGLNWDDYPKSSLTPFIPEVVVRNTLIYTSYYAKGLAYTEDLEKGEEINSRGLPSNEVKLVEYFNDQFYVLASRKWYKNTSIKE